jgi:hypothetical protein
MTIVCWACGAVCWFIRKCVSEHANLVVDLSKVVHVVLTCAAAAVCTYEGVLEADVCVSCRAKKGQAE